MKERDYLIATAATRLRAVDHLLREVQFPEPRSKLDGASDAMNGRDRIAAITAVGNMLTRLARALER